MPLWSQATKGSPPEPESQASSPEAGQARWLSQGWESVLHGLRSGDLPADEAGCHCDVLIVGSGYGGAVAAAELAGSELPDGRAARVWLLERGQEHLPGSFPSELGELPGHVRWSRAGQPGVGGRRDGLFDVRIQPDLCALVGNGLGGGSLINAGVMDWPDVAVFAQDHWPRAIRDERDGLARQAQELAEVLGARRAGPAHPWRHHTQAHSPHAPAEAPPSAVNGVASAGCAPSRLKALESLSGCGAVREAPITVALHAQPSADGVQLDACLHCGDCATGCNHNAKVSLDTNLLARARRLGTRVVTGATAWRLSPAPGGWDVDVIHTDEQAQRREGRPHTVRARRVIVAAGTLGSTELLLRSRGPDLPLSHRLGERLSGNGDMIAVLHDVHDEHGQGVPINGVANEAQPPAQRQVGPTITGIFEQRLAGQLPQVIEDLAVPGPMRRVFEEIFQTAHALHALGLADASDHTGLAGEADPLALSEAMTRRSMAVALIGHDGADGRLRLRDAQIGQAPCDAQLDIAWPTLRDDPSFDARQRSLQDLCESQGWRASVLPNPAWRPLPGPLEDLFGQQRGPLLTVHPLGGCAMGEDAARGVVNDLGEVFDPRSADGRGVHAGLVVLDGAIVPGSLGTNPALTIATLAQRGVTRLRARWGWRAPDPAPGPLRPRPRLRQVPEPVPHERTRVELGERLRGWWGDAGIELTLRFGPQDLQALVRGDPGARILRVSPGLSQVRRVRRASQAEVDARGGDPWHEDFTLDRQPLQGSLRVLHREPSSPLGRTARGLWAWWLNRGWRDTTQHLADRMRGDQQAQPPHRSLIDEVGRRFRGAWRLASRAGEVRRFDYELQVLGDGPWAGEPLHGHKRLTYAVGANPWRQLMDVTLTRAPGLKRRGDRPVLSLDLADLAQQGLALMRVSHQHHLPDTWVDLIGLVLWVARLLLHTHVWSLRLPDPPRPGPIDRLPRSSHGLPPHEVTELAVAPDLPDGTPVRLRLSRVRSRSPHGQPILLLHGYSAGGTTFLHPSVPQGLARTLWDAGFDVWVADLRTSPGLPTATHPWAFEDVAHHDIPIAIDHIWRHTGERPIDVFAHCMGSAMLWMGLLGDPLPGHAEHEALRLAMPERIRRIGMSQVAPLVDFAPDNLFRAFIARHALGLLPQGPFHFRPPSQASFADGLLDRLLSTLPYPPDEWRRENPLWPVAARTPWVGSRHRMDLLYGRDFKLANLPQSVLDDIDEHFGPLNLATLTQALHMARAGGLASADGQALCLRPERLAKVLQRIPVMSVHGRENALSSVTGLLRFRAWVDGLGEGLAGRYTHHIIEGHGHQDCLIGVHAPREVFPLVLDFLRQTDQAGGAEAELAKPIAHPPVPWAPLVTPVPLGPFLGTAFSSPTWRDGEPHWPVTIGRDPSRPEPALIACVPRNPRGQLGEPHLLPWPAAASAHGIGSATMRTLAVPASWWAEDGHQLGFFFVQGPARTPNQAERAHIVAAVLKAADLAEASPGACPPPLDRLASPPATLEPPAAEPCWVPCPPRACLADALAAGLTPLTPSAAPCADQASPAGAPWVLALGSCLYPGSLAERTPPGPSWQAGPPDHVWQRLLRWRRQRGHPPLELAILSGDQIYADATAGLFDPRTTHDRFDQPHQAMLAQRLLRQALAGVPVHTLIDDHEIVDNWSWLAGDRPRADLPRDDNRQRRADGLRAYRQHQRFAQPVRHPVDPRDPTARPARLWYAFAHRDLPVFVADTRTQREPRTIARFEQARIMGRAQWACLLHWLAHHGPDERPTFVASPSIVLPRRLLSDTLQPASAALADAWEAHPRSLHALLAHLCRTQARHVVFLSGDEHLSCIARLRIRREGDGPDREVVAHSVHSSALYAPYPFANSRPHDFHARDSFTFTDLHEGRLEHFHCRVDTDFAPPGDGLALIETSQGPDGCWHVNVSWDRESGLTRHTLF